MNNSKPTFETFAAATIERATGTYTQRGQEYKDSWAAPATNMLDAVCSKLGVSIPEESKRAIMLAVLVDVKYNRLVGGYKDDTVVDMINYELVLAEAMQRITGIVPAPVQ